MIGNSIAGLTGIGAVPIISGVQFLVISGAGGAGSGAVDTAGGGSGAGGYRSSVVGESSGGGGSAFSPFSFTPSTNYSVTVGAGGVSRTGAKHGNQGTPTRFDFIYAVGGGGGGGGANAGDTGSAGGSGGGGGGNNGAAAAGGAGSVSQ